MVKEIEDEYNVNFVETETFDPGPAFLGNRADIISVGTFEITAIEQETGLKTVTFGRAGDNPYVIAVRPDNPAEHARRPEGSVHRHPPGRVGTPLRSP